MPRLFYRFFFVGTALAASSIAAADPPRHPVIVRSVPQPSPTPTVPVPGQPVFAIDRFARAEANLRALLDGRRSVADLDPQELEDVLELDRRLRGTMPDTRTPEQRCVDDEVRRNGSRPTELAWRVIELKCRETGG